MNPNRICDASDIARVEAQPYRSFMRHEHVYDALADSAKRHADRRALTFIVSADPSVAFRRWSHAQLLADVTRAANLFHELAGGEQPRVAMLLPAIPEAYLTLWGGETAGIVCPINYLLNADHVAELIRAAGANILVTLGPHAELDIWSGVSALRHACPALKHVLAVGAVSADDDYMTRVAAMPSDSLTFQPARGPDAPAALFHTGGTTGAPKLARHTHLNQLHAAWGAAQMYASDERDVILNGFPLFHVAGSFVFGLSTLLVGGEVVLPTLLGLRNTAFVQRYWTFAERCGVTLLAAVPTVISTLLNTDPGTARITGVRALLTGGSPLSPELASAFEQRFAIPVRNILGMTECAGVVSIEPFYAARVAGSCGLPLPFTKVEATGEDGRPCAAGETGILRLRGPNVSPGYTDERRNAGTFTEDGWLVTGDIGYVDAEGRVFVTGRSKDVIIRGGHNIDPGVIEDALLRHPAVLMAAAVGEPDEYAGELPVAFVTLKPGVVVEPGELAAFAQQYIPERPAYPKRIDVVSAIPLTAVGKVYKPALRVLATERVVHARMAAAHLSEQVNAQVVESGSGASVLFSPKAPATRQIVEPRVREIMGRFAIAYRLDDGEVAGSSNR
jgi:fatty-acyl-CoA synthase